MASTIHTPTSPRPEDSSAENIAAAISPDDLDAAKHDPRVAAFLAEGDHYLAALEQQGRNR